MTVIVVTVIVVTVIVVTVIVVTAIVVTVIVVTVIVVTVIVDNQQVIWEVAVFAIISRNCSSQVVKNARAFSALTF